ncbi:hypothetical protein ABL78_5779 [Leptomonas seymouri]|uniref:Uncharacterized protein n=1 Tax=Leptomonas seymouri TaxID=5684 RepID=A0A0N1PAE2_LEPSE|nr:hypothetical protein ABL78_5779 [Leptomonas seymouri]|eukprot:KPI85154.1 hypothetical protein ABL78_5779 [Leptomonas seymouri]
MPSETRFSVHVRGCATAAYKINESRNCVMDLTSVLLAAQDNVRQIQMLNHVLGIRSAVPKPPAEAVPPKTRPSITNRKTSRDDTNTNIDEAGFSDMCRMDCIERGLPGSGLKADRAATSLGSSTSNSSRTFVPVSAMQRLAHAVPGDLPIDIVATNALGFVAGWRKEDQKCAAQDDLIHECLSSHHTIERNEAESRWRLSYLLFSATEQLSRFAILDEYENFIRFCVVNEPIWQQAAQQLERDNSARLNTTANMYARFLLADTVMSEKMKMYQEAADFVISLRLMEREQYSAAHKTAVARRRRQSASQVLAPVAPPRHSKSHKNRKEAAASAPHMEPNSSSSQNNNHEKTVDDAHAARQVKPLPSMERDKYREGWRAILGTLTNGKLGRPARADSASVSTLAAAAAPPKGSGKHHKHKLPVQPEGVLHKSSKGDERPHRPKSESVVLAPLKDERKPRAKPPSHAEGDPGVSLPPVQRDPKKPKKR